MRKALLLIIALLLVVSSGYSKTYTLDSYLEDVKQFNKDLKMAQKDREIASSQKRQAWSQALPTVALQASYTRNLTDYYMYFDTSALMPGGGISKIPSLRENEFNTTFALQQTLFSPSVGLGIKAARQYEKLSDFVYEANLQGIATAAKKVYYQCLLLEKVYQVNEASEANAHENYELMVASYENGQISQLELLQAETRWRNAIPDKMQAERNLQLLKNTLKNLAGLDVKEEIKLEGSLDSVPDMPRFPDLNNVLAKRPDFQALTWEEKLRETSAVASRGYNQIQLSGSLAYVLSAQSNEFQLDEENKLLTAGITLSVPIFTGGYLKAAEQENKIILDKTRVNIEKQQDEISRTLEDTYLTLAEANKRIESAVTILSTAEKAFSIAEITSRDGLATQLELKDARVGFDQAQINYYAASYDYLAAYFDWEQALGKADI